MDLLNPPSVIFWPIFINSINSRPPPQNPTQTPKKEKESQRLSTRTRVGVPVPNDFWADTKYILIFVGSPQTKQVLGSVAEIETAKSNLHPPPNPLGYLIVLNFLKKLNLRSFGNP